MRSMQLRARGAGHDGAGRGNDVSSESLKQRVIRQFGKPTGIPGRIAGWIMANRPSDRERSLRTLGLLQIEPGDRVMEIGFGPGVAIGEAAKLANRGHVAGIDHSGLMVQVAERRNAVAIADGRVTLYLASPANMPDFPQPFDKAYAVNVHMFWQDKSAALQNILQTLRYGGVFALTFQPRNVGASDEDAKRAGEAIVTNMRDAGFGEIQVELFKMKPVSTVCVVGRRPSIDA
jgi:SAM-dependent methyltransferase